jgi:hypothetical protein
MAIVLESTLPHAAIAALVTVLKTVAAQDVFL